MDSRWDCWCARAWNVPAYAMTVTWSITLIRSLLSLYVVAVYIDTSNLLMEPFFLSLSMYTSPTTTDNRYRPLLSILAWPWHISTWLLIFAVWFCCSGFSSSRSFVFFDLVTTLTAEQKKKGEKKYYGRYINTFDSSRSLRILRVSYSWVIPKKTKQTRQT